MSKAARMEVLPSPQEVLRAPAEEAEVMRRAVEIAARIAAEKDTFLFEPFFRSRKVAYELKRLQTVSEQRKWTLYFQRFGCLICETMERMHTANGMCSRCYANTFQRLKQIIGEAVSGETARPARGRLRLDRLLPASAIPGLHHTRHERTTAKEHELFARVAEQLGLTPAYVKAVAVGNRRSDAVADALKKEAEKMRKEHKD